MSRNTGSPLQNGNGTTDFYVGRIFLTVPTTLKLYFNPHVIRRCVLLSLRLCVDPSLGRLRHNGARGFRDVTTHFVYVIVLAVTSQYWRR